MIRYPLTFAAYNHFRFGDKLTAGDYTVNGGMSYDEMRRSISPKKNAREQIRLTIPEGYTTDAIIDIFVKNGIGTKEKFAEVINGYDFDYDFVRAIPEREGRTYRLDGYLFPDTYFFYKDSSEVEAISKLLRNFDGKFGAKMRDDALSSGISCDDAVILASIIEKEAFFKEDMPKISSVFHNRLAGSRKYLESDATVRYFLAVSGENTATFTAEQMRIVNPYNTYRSEGLPPGAICNAGADALYAAIYPEKRIISILSAIRAVMPSIRGHTASILRLPKNTRAMMPEKDDKYDRITLSRGQSRKTARRFSLRSRRRIFCGRTLRHACRGGQFHPARDRGGFRLCA